MVKQMSQRRWRHPDAIIFDNYSAESGPVSLDCDRRSIGIVSIRDEFPKGAPWLTINAIGDPRYDSCVSTERCRYWLARRFFVELPDQIRLRNG